MLSVRLGSQNGRKEGRKEEVNFFSSEWLTPHSGPPLFSCSHLYRLIYAKLLSLLDLCSAALAIVSSLPCMHDVAYVFQSCFLFRLGLDFHILWCSGDFNFLNTLEELYVYVWTSWTVVKFKYSIAHDKIWVCILLLNSLSIMGLCSIMLARTTITCN